jgi:tetratricopeptide (TPR) repeat protein
MVVAVGMVMRASAQAMLDPRDEFVAEIGDGLAAYRATGARFQSTYHLVLLARALAACGRHDEGLAAWREATDLAAKTGERYVETEIHRVEGNLLLAKNDRAGAEACYERALDIARAQQARSLELRGAGDLARLRAEGVRCAGAGLQLVHRGLRDRRPERRKSAARRADVSRGRAESPSCFSEASPYITTDIPLFVNCQYRHCRVGMLSGHFPCRVPAASLRESIGVPVAAPYVLI